MYVLVEISTRILEGMVPYKMTKYSVCHVTGNRYSLVQCNSLVR